ncbi:Hypp5853 [Branchiostoma lanceolatum]|uniref:Hypp5853 protein n=1 Tax=Branchiostoma lanceolatum TaxID=7740 RepID=A0A8J9VKK7_BRALA|nr:Hypp5853 [Branchiostoma lanceolatum]
MHKALLQKLRLHRLDLVVNLSYNIDTVVDYLCRDDVIARDEKDSIISHERQEDRVTCLLDILENKDDDAFYVFRDTLVKTGPPHLPILLDGKAEVSSDQLPQTTDSN